MVVVNGNEIVLSGTVGDLFWDEGFTAGEVIAALAQVGHENPVTVRLNSGGGIATEGAAIHAALARHAGQVTVVVEGIAASAAATVAMAGDEIVMSLGAVMMIHDPSGFTFGTVQDHETQIRALTALATAMASIYAGKSGRTIDQTRADMTAETWMTAEEAVSLGYADRVASNEANDNEPKPVPAEITAFDYRLYANAPERLVALADASGWKARASKAASPAAPTRQQETSMPNDPAGNNPANPPTDPAANVVNLDEARSQGRSEALAYVREVNEICALAGQPEKATAFIEADTKPDAVRKALLDARAEADAARAVTSHILPHAGAAGQGGSAPKKVTASAGMLKLIGKGA